MALKYSNSQEFLNKLQLYINAFIAVPMLGFIVLFLRIENRTYNPDYLNEAVTFYLRFIMLVAILTLIVLGVVLSNKIRKSLDPNMSIRDKLNVYYKAAIKRAYFFLGATVIALIGLTLTAEQFYVIYYTICLVAFSITYPTIYRINRELKLNREEREVIISRKKIK
jgi:cytochrome c biogenesis factor